MNDTDALWSFNPLSRILLENLDQGVMILDDQCRVRIWNAWLVSHTGLSAEVVDHRFLKEIFPDLPPATLRTIKEVLREGEPRVLSPLLHADWFPFIKAKHQLMRLLPLPEEDRGMTGVIIFIRDLTGAMDYEGGLEERYRSLVESFAEHIFMLGPDGVYLASNNQVKQFALLSGKDLVGKHVNDVYPDDMAELYREQIEKVLKTGRQVEFEHEMPEPDGPRYHMDTLYPIRRDEQVWAIGGICRDITERKRLEKEKMQIENQLLQSQKMEAVGLLAGGVAHDFNNSLSIIMGNAELISMDMSEHSPFRERIEEIVHAAKNAAVVIRQLLIFSRKQIVRPRVIFLNDVLTDLEKMLHRLIGENIRFVTVKTPDLWPVSMDPGQLEQVIINLAVNGRDAMPKGGMLTLKTANVDLDETYFNELGLHSAIGPYTMLSLSDSGVGMDRETRSRIFEPFFTTKEKGQGTGLGLATVYGIVKKAKGYIWADSEPGEGTTFKIYLPRAERRDETGKTKAAPVQQITGTETILIVEDDVSLQGLMKSVLEGYGYRVLAAKDGEAAIALGETHEGEIELLLADVVLPGIGGTDLSDALKEKRPEMKVLFTSGYTDDIISRYGVAPSEMDLLEKPFTPESLALKVREVLDRA